MGVFVNSREYERGANGMGITARPLEQLKIWNAYRLLCSGNVAERRCAIHTLKTLAPASLPCLRFCIEGQNVKRTQFAAAVALRQLGEPIEVDGEPLGLKTLTENLRLLLPHRGDMAPELEAAWLALDEPDATTELLKVWNRATYWSDSNLVLICIGHVWAKRREPRVLEALARKADSVPKIFEETITAFGEEALPVLEKMTTDPNPHIRILAVQALKKIMGVRSLNLLAPLLRDADPVTRAQVPQAMLKTGWPAESVRQIGLALEAGFSSPEALGVMEEIGPIHYAALIQLISRWDPTSRKVSGDTELSVFAALRLLEKSRPDDGTLLPALRALLRRGLNPSLTAETIRIIGVVGLRDAAPLNPLREEILPFLSCADDTTRGSAARVLDLFGVSLGVELEHLLAETRPQESLLTKFQAILLGGAEAEAAADKALQQVGGWLTKVTKDTAGRFGATNSPLASPTCADARLPETLNTLLLNALTALGDRRASEETAERLSLCVACLRVAARFRAEQATVLHGAIVRAFHCVRFGLIAGRVTGGAMRSGDVEEVGRLVRQEASATLLQIYGADAFPLFIEGLYASAIDIRLTAVSALGRLGDARALPHLAPSLARPGNPLFSAAKEADALIRGANPEIMTLLRASSAQSDARPETLLRPALYSGNATPPDQLLRPAPSE